MKHLLTYVKQHGLIEAVKAAARGLRGRVAVRSDPSLYEKWVLQQEPSVEDLERMRMLSSSFQYQPLLSVVTPVYNTNARWLRACIESVKNQAYPHWQLCLADDGSTNAETLYVLREYAGDARIKIIALEKNSGISAALNAALTLADGDFVAFLDHDDEITPDALFEVVSHLNGHPDADVLYSDEDKLDHKGARCDVFFKPDWSPEHFLSANYACHLMVVRRSLIARIGGFRAGYEGAQDYDLVLHLMEHTTHIHHLSKVLYHWRKTPQSTASAGGAKSWAHDAGTRSLEDYVKRNSLDARVLPGGLPGLYRVCFGIKEKPLVSIVLPALSGLSETDLGAANAYEQSVRTLADRTAYRRFEVILLSAGDDQAYARIERMLGDSTHHHVRIDEEHGSSRMSQLNVGAAHDHLLFLDWGLNALDGEWLTALLEYSQQAAVGAVGGKLLYPDGYLKHIGLLVGVNGVVAPALHRYPSASLGYFCSAIGVRNYSAVSAACMMTRRGLFEQVGGFREELNYFDEDASRLRTLWSDQLLLDPYYNVNLSRRSPDYEPDLAEP
jgi:GT2 family glycosyltransferase